MNKIRVFVDNLLRSHWEKLLIGLLPFFLLGIHSYWLINKTDIDVWFYYGYFRNFLDYWNTYSVDEARTYYGTRLPYIVPGHLVYSIFDAATARYVFNLLLVYPLVIFSFWFVVKAHTARSTAFVVSVMFATDIFFIRAMGSDYVDSGVLLYQLLTLALLTRASQLERPRILLVLAGFTAACMTLTHLLSAIFLPLFLAYYCFFSEGEKTKHGVTFLGTFALVHAGVGALICIAICGLIFVYTVNGPFLFFLPQVRMLFLDSTSNYQLSVDYLFSSGYWLTIHLATLTSALLALVSTGFGKRLSNRYVLFWLATGPMLYGLLAIFKLDGLWFLASRDGLYATFFFPMTYFTLGALLFRNKPLGIGAAGVVAATFFGSIAIRLSIGDGAGIQAWHSFPMIAVALFIGAVSFVGFILAPNKPWISPVSACIIGVATAAIPWRFDGNASVFGVHDVVENEAQGRLPKFFWSKSNDASSHADFASITASFTERAWWQRGWGFPDCTQVDGGSIQPGDLIVILSRNGITTSALNEFAECVGDVVKAGSFTFRDRQGDYQLQFVEVPRNARTTVFRRNADTLPSQTGGIRETYRFAGGGSKEGFLTFGPYVDVASGRYELVLTYFGNAEGSWWDIVSLQDGRITSLAQGNLADSNGRVSEVKVEIDLTKGAKRLEMRTYFSGKGDLEVHRVSATRLGK